MADEKKFYTEKEIIRRLYRISYVFHDLMIKHHIPYYASSGTLLGVMRHKGIIPWDNDADFCISITNEMNFLSTDVKKSFDKNGYRIEKSINGWYRISDKKYKKVSVDVFFVEYIKDKKSGEWFSQHTGKAFDFWPNERIRVKDLFPLKERSFGSGIILTPNRPEKSLTLFYGKSWKKVGYITMDPDEHLDLDEPIKLKVSRFTAAKPFYYKKQIHLDKTDPYLEGRV